MIRKELKKGAVELLVLSILEDAPRHGYEIGKLIEERSEGELRFHIASLYPILYRLERRGWIRGSWERKPQGRRRRKYELTSEGQRALADELSSFRSFISAVERIARLRHA